MLEGRDILCDIGPEGDACAFLLDVKREDTRAQSVCRGLYPVAKAMQEHPGSQPEWNAWAQARHQLAPLGFVANDRTGRIDEKLKAAGGTAGHLVERAEGAFHEGETKTAEGAERASEAEGR